MIKKHVTFTDYDGQPKTVLLHFHLSKFEWLELETFTKGGLIENLKTAIESGNAKKTVGILTKIILTAYGEKNEDTGEFEKNENNTIRFSKTEAFSELFYELAYKEEASTEFFMGLIPDSLKAEATQMLDKQKQKDQLFNRVETLSEVMISND